MSEEDAGVCAAAGITITAEHTKSTNCWKAVFKSSWYFFAVLPMQGGWQIPAAGPQSAGARCDQTGQSTTSSASNLIYSCQALADDESRGVNPRAYFISAITGSGTLFLIGFTDRRYA